MAKSRRTRRASNKIAGSLQGALVKADPSGDSTTPVHRLNLVTVPPRSTLFTAELEEVIEIIARERVYRAMLAGLRRRLLTAPATSGEDSTA